MLRSLMFAFAPVALAATVVFGAGCGGKQGTLALNVVVSPTDDPFVDATQVRISVGDMMHVTTSAITGMGHFDLKVKQKPLKPGPILLEALDASGNVIAHGSTPTLNLDATDQNGIGIWVGRVGRIAAAPDKLPSPRVEFSAAPVTGLGVVYTGGRGADGKALADTAIYDVYTQHVLVGSPMSKARAGAVGGPIGTVRSIAFGGANSSGFGQPAGADASVELFDPTSTDKGIWAPLAADTFTARAYAVGTSLASGALLITGGVDAGGNRLGSAALINPSGTIRLSTLASAMQAARSGHAVATASFPDGEGAFIFGGLGGGSGPIAERYVGQAFAAVDLPADVRDRLNATATRTPGGDVLVAGGTIDGVAVASGLVYKTSTKEVVKIDNLMSTPRSEHTAILVNGQILICGGVDNSGAVLASCDLLDGMTYGPVRALNMTSARRGHTATPFETGPVLLAGGYGSDGAPLVTIEIYTP